jgi:hypothetical protein
MAELNVCSIEVKKSGSGVGDEVAEIELDRRARRRLAMGRGANESADGLSRREVTRVARMVWCVQNDEREGA